MDDYTKEREEEILGLYGLFNSDYVDNCINKCWDGICLCIDIEEMCCLLNVKDDSFDNIYLNEDYRHNYSIDIFSYRCDKSDVLFRFLDYEENNIDEFYYLETTGVPFVEQDFWQVMLVSLMINSQNELSKRRSLCELCVYCDCGGVLLKRYLYTHINRCIDLYLNNETQQFELCVKGINEFLKDILEVINDVIQNENTYERLERYIIAFKESIDRNKQFLIYSQVEVINIGNKIIYWANEDNNNISFVFKESGNDYNDEVEFYKICFMALGVIRICGYKCLDDLDQLILYNNKLQELDTNDKRYSKLFKILNNFIDNNYDEEKNRKLLEKLKYYLSDYDDLSTEKLDELCLYIDNLLK